MRLLVALLLIASFAGCAESYEPGPAGADSREASGLGEDLAKAWSGDARLAGVIGFEPGNDTEIQEEYPEARVPADYQHGDGRAYFWALNFTSQAKNQTLMLILDGTGAELERIIEDGAVTPLPKYKIDSVAAVAVLHREVDNFTARMEAGATLLYALEHHDDLLFWSIMEWGDSLCFHAVGAQNGTLVDSECLELDFTFLVPAEWGNEEGTLTVLAPSATFQVTTDMPHESIYFAIRLDANAPVGSVIMAIEGEDGATGRVVTSPSPVGGSDSRVGLPAMDANSWTVTVTLEGGALQGFDIYWCTTGMAISFGTFFGQHPCDVARP